MDKNSYDIKEITKNFVWNFFIVHLLRYFFVFKSAFSDSIETGLKSKLNINNFKNKMFLMMVLSHQLSKNIEL